MQPASDYRNPLAIHAGKLRQMQIEELRARFGDIAGKHTEKNGETAQKFWDSLSEAERQHLREIASHLGPPLEIEGVFSALNDALGALARFGDITGKHTETLVAARELRRLIQILNAEAQP